MSTNNKAACANNYSSVTLASYDTHLELNTIKESTFPSLSLPRRDLSCFPCIAETILIMLLYLIDCLVRL